MNELDLFGGNEIKVIKSENVLGKDFKIYGTVDEPLFLAKEIAEWIEHSDVSMMLKPVDDDEKLTQTLFVSGQNRNYWFLTENGLYEVLMLSRKPIAKEFKRAVKKVLHSLRVNGGYIANQENLSDDELMAKALITAQKIIANKDKMISEMKPKAEVYDDFLSRDKFCNFRDGASYLGISQTEFMDILKSKYIYKNNIGEYRAYAEYTDYFTLRPFARGTERTGQQLMLNLQGLEYFGKLLKREIA